MRFVLLFFSPQANENHQADGDMSPLSDKSPLGNTALSRECKYCQMSLKCFFFLFVFLLAPFPQFPHRGDEPPPTFSAPAGLFEPPIPFLPQPRCPPPPTAPPRSRLLRTTRVPLRPKPPGTQISGRPDLRKPHLLQPGPPRAPSPTPAEPHPPPPRAPLAAALATSPGRRGTRRSPSPGPLFSPRVFPSQHW